MKRTKVESSNLISVGYDADKYTMEIEFKGGRIYRYYPISRYMWEKFLQADSKGTYFNTRIRKNKRINCEEVDELQAET